jgi:hypothetical protein
MNPSQVFSAKKQLKANWRNIYHYLRSNNVSSANCAMFILNLFLTHESISEIFNMTRVTITRKIGELSTDLGFENTVCLIEYLSNLKTEDSKTDWYIPRYLELQVKIIEEPFNPHVILSELIASFGEISASDNRELLIHMLHGASTYSSKKCTKE